MSSSAVNNSSSRSYIFRSSDTRYTAISFEVEVVEPSNEFQIWILRKLFLLSSSLFIFRNMKLNIFRAP
ncbi:hypothetical protein HanRHA438_Chr12g0555781 [Helianthus annuus]|uniref:Uncharacterized protein n=1 Tax=Helianthus annuus TaxID=4232 RepID=A0A9K3HH51_HELAN|nr:hypothetical protein HanXRQr2_Chr12g0544541 [Helianthus annuus]KAJ0862947.1 hypothetical protein HanPSC8_Chr12g0524201 [Helianthus annuus]KAJ0866790.1 hypothetical protein HanRHA438_Chr12g0555781 [Helianthus annuus]